MRTNDARQLAGSPASLGLAAFVRYQRGNQGAWQILFGANDPLYTDGGTTQHTAQRHLIGSA